MILYCCIIQGLNMTFAVIFSLQIINLQIMLQRLLFIILLLTPTALAAQDSIAFSLLGNGEPLKTNEMRYTSALGLQYQVAQVQFFVSNIKLRLRNGDTVSYPGSVHYVDADIPSTLKWKPAPDFSLRNADSITFTFGLHDADNRSYRFRNPPENLMFWPDYLGGGYHYMKTNILYISQDGNVSAFNCHIGRGQIYNAEKEPVSFIDNAFEVSVPFLERSDGNAEIYFDICNIFDSPSPVLFSSYGGIMNNQEAMSLFCRNIKQELEWLSQPK